MDTRMQIPTDIMYDEPPAHEFVTSIVTNMYYWVCVVLLRHNKIECRYIWNGYYSISSDQLLRSCILSLFTYKQNVTMTVWLELRLRSIHQWRIMIMKCVTLLLHTLLVNVAPKYLHCRSDACCFYLYARPFVKSVQRTWKHRWDCSNNRPNRNEWRNIAVHSAERERGTNQNRQLVMMQLSNPPCGTNISKAFKKQKQKW